MDNREQFIFETLDVYNLAVGLYGEVRRIKLSSEDNDRIIARQLIRAALSVSLNIAEGSGKSSLRDKRNFLVIARGSLYECVAIFNVLKVSESISPEQYHSVYSISIRISKMLLAMIRRIDQQSVQSKK